MRARRRAFLALLGLTLSGAGSWPRPGGGQVRVPSGDGRRVAVIGAGLAGLAAARTLQDLGYDVVVVEARDRIGGRVWTSHRWADLPVDLGASWIHGVAGNPLTGLADAVGAVRWPTRYDRWIAYHASGRPISEEDDARIDRLRARLFRALRRAQERESDVSVRRAVETLAREVGEDAESRRVLNFLLSSELEQEYAGSAATLSAHWFDDGEEFDGGDALFAQGYGVMADYLARGLRIETGAAVQEIRWRESPLRILTQRAGFVADHVVITLPLGVLQAGTVRFVPELPTRKREAVERLGMGVLNKCCLRFGETFWPDDVDWIEYVSAKPGEWTEWLSLARVAGKPVLLGFNAAEQGRAIEAASDPQIVADAMRTLRTIYGAGIPEPVDYQITRWASDPFARGAYSYNALGAAPGMRDDLAAPLGTQVFFAGEATTRAYFGTAHGAYLSGLRAAREIAAA